MNLKAAAFTLLLIFIQLDAKAQVSMQQGMSLQSVEYFWKEAIELYITETEDYLESLSSTEQELKNWRLRVLQDKFETRISGLEVILSKSNFEELAQLEKSVEKNGINSLDDSLMMRLAQLHYDRAGFDFNLKAKKLREQRTFKGEMPTPDYRKTIFYSSEIIKRFPKSTILDHAYYLLGFCLFDENKDKKAAFVYQEMLKHFPSNPLSFEARWKLAEYYFEQGQFKLAAENYQYLITHPNAFSQKAIYKLGATLYEEKKYDQAYKIFLKLYLDSAERLGTRDPEAETLNTEALDYLAYLKTKNIDMPLDENTDSLVVQRLSSIYKQKLNDKNARFVQVAYAQQHPLSKYAPRFLEDAIESYEYDGLYGSAQKVRNIFLNSYKADSAFWKKYENDVSTTVEIQDLYESVLLSSAHFFADLARKNKKGDYYQQAIDHYYKFVEEYPVSPLKSLAKFEMAELQYFSGRYADAAATYMDMTIDTDSDEYRDEAAYGFFLSEMKRINYDPSFSHVLSPDVGKEGRLNPPSDLSQQEKKFFEAADFYTKNVAQGFRRQKILYKKAELLYKHNQFKAARDNLEQVFKDQELSSIAPRALRLMAETYNIEGNWQKVLETKKLQIEISRRQGFDASQAEELFKSKSPILASAWKSEKKGDLKDASEQYEYYSVKYARSSEAPATLFRAALLYRNMGQITESNRLLARLTKDYAQSSYLPQAEFLKASNEENYLNFEEAMNAYERIFKKHPKKEIGLQALLNSASLHFAQNDYKGAGKRYEEYAKILNDDAALLTAAEIYKKAGDKSLALKIYSDFSRGKKGPALAVEAYLNMAEIAKTTEQRAEYCKSIKSLSQVPQIANSATAQHAMTGCMYFKSKPYAQRVNKEKLEKNWDNLSKVYDYIMASEDYEWLKEVYQDLKNLYERTQFEPANNKLAEVQKKLEQNKIDYFKVSQIPYKEPEAETLFVRWPLESSLTRVAYDQKKWEDLIKNAETELSIKPQAYLHVAIARGYAEKKDWAKAIEQLKKCFAETKDAVCSAHRSLIDSSYLFEDSTFELDDEAVIALASAVRGAKQGKDSRAEFKKAVRLQPQLPDIYKYYSLYLTERKNYELAKLVLDAGLRNTQGDERLLVQKGFLALEQKNMDMALAVVNEMKYYDTGSDDSLAYRALYYYLDNNPKQAQMYMAQLQKSQSNKVQYALKIMNTSLERMPAGDKK